MIDAFGIKRCRMAFEGRSSPLLVRRRTVFSLRPRSAAVSLTLYANREESSLLSGRALGRLMERGRIGNSGVPWQRSTTCLSEG
jgi:hypothetical protein